MPKLQLANAEGRPVQTLECKTPNQRLPLQSDASGALFGGIAAFAGEYVRQA